MFLIRTHEEGSNNMCLYVPDYMLHSVLLDRFAMCAGPSSMLTAHKVEEKIQTWNVYILH